MFNIKKILCPVDFSAASNKALNYAVDLALDYHAKIHLLHILTPIIPAAYDYAVSTVAMMKSLEKASASQMKRLERALRKRGADVTAQVLTGDVHGLLKRAILETKPELIVIGSHARTGFERLFMGSVAEWLMRNSTVPVLVISEKQKAAKRKRGLKWRHEAPAA